MLDRYTPQRKSHKKARHRKAQNRMLKHLLSRMHPIDRETYLRKYPNCLFR